MENKLIMDSLSIIDYSPALALNDTIKYIDVSPSLTTWQYLAQPNTIITLVAIFISIYTLIITSKWNRRTYKLAERHNTLIVKPLLKISCLIENDMYQVKLINSGFGSCIFEKVEYYYNGKLTSKLIEILNERSKELDIYFKGTYGIFNKFSLKSGESIPIFESVGNFRGNINDYFKLFSGISIHINFKDIYDNHEVFEDNIVSEEIIENKMNPNFLS